MTWEYLLDLLRKLGDFVKQRKYLGVLLLPCFLLLFFGTQDNGHKGRLIGKDYDYQGQIRDEHPEGLGKMTFKNGNVYQGNFKSGSFNGKGELTDQVNKWTYSGSFSNGQPNGMGKLKLADGTVKTVKFKMGVLAK